MLLQDKTLWLLHQSGCGAQAGAESSLNKGTDHDKWAKGSLEFYLELGKHLYISVDDKVAQNTNSLWSMQLGRGLTPNTNTQTARTDQLCNGLKLNSAADFLSDPEAGPLFFCIPHYATEHICRRKYLLSNKNYLSVSGLGTDPDSAPSLRSCHQATGLTPLSQASGPSWPGAASYREPTNQEQERRQYYF